MRKCPVAVIREVIAAFDLEGTHCVEKLGVKLKSVSAMVTKYSSSIPDIDYFIVFNKASGGNEISFVCNNCHFDFASVEKEFGALEINYNFRENYSEFKTRVLSRSVADLYFVKDNKFQISVPDHFTETTPQGVIAHHIGLEFSAFCLRLKS